jgi:hypothetical protein
VVFPPGDAPIVILKEVRTPTKGPVNVFTKHPPPPPLNPAAAVHPGVSPVAVGDGLLYLVTPPSPPAPTPIKTNSFIPFGGIKVVVDVIVISAS